MLPITRLAVSRSTLLVRPSLRLATKQHIPTPIGSSRFYGRPEGKAKLIFGLAREDVPVEVYPLLFIVFVATTGAAAFSFRHTYTKVMNELPLRWWPTGSQIVETESSLREL